MMDGSSTSTSLSILKGVERTWLTKFNLAFHVLYLQSYSSAMTKLMTLKSCYTLVKVQRPHLSPDTGFPM